MPISSATRPLNPPPALGCHPSSDGGRKHTVMLCTPSLPAAWMPSLQIFIALVCALVLSALHRWRAADLRRTPLTDARAGPISVLQLIGVFLVVWWIPGAGVLTFVGPFVVTSNGYFGAWAGLLASLWLLSLALIAARPLWQRAIACAAGVALMFLLPVTVG